MPWTEVTPIDHRLQFVAAARRTDESFRALCTRFVVALKTGYKWLAHYEAAGRHARSRRQHPSPTATPPAVAAALLELRRSHPAWGAKKLLAVLARRQSRLVLPAPSNTVAALLAHAGFVTPRRRRRALGQTGRSTAPMNAPNDVWTADFKGEFTTRDGVYCYPLTICDGCSRYLLACRALPSAATARARPVFERLFREHRLPTRIRSDNGVPFASIALARLSALSVWWLRLGILPDRTQPSSPQQNDRHERMRRTLKAEATRPAAASARAQQRVFDRLRRECNSERPHEARGQSTPASAYAPSPRPYPRRLPVPEYPAHWEVHRVSLNGGIRWGDAWVKAIHLRAEASVAFDELAEGLWPVYFGPLRIGRFEERLLRIVDQNDGTTSRTFRRVLPRSLD